MIVLRATAARFAREGVEIVAPFSFELEAGATHALEAETPYAASVAARLCAAIVKPTTGRIVASEFDSRLQAPEAKRRIGFVDARGFAGDAHAFACEVAFRADVWGIAHDVAHERARSALEALRASATASDAVRTNDARASDERYDRAIALALVADITTLVLDAPAPAIVERVRAIARAAAIVHTRVMA